MTSTETADSFDISFEFTASPEQAKTGEQVTFAAQIANNGKTPVTGIRFTNSLPADFSDFQSDDKRFIFDAQTNALIWSEQTTESAQGTGQGLLPGESLTLTYSVYVQSQAVNAQIVDSASLSAAGLQEPLLAEATLTLISSKDYLTLLDEKGGEAIGLDGRIKIDLPERSLDAEKAISIRDASGDFDAAPPLVFELGLQLPQTQDAQSLVPAPDVTPLPEESSTPMPEATPTALPEVTPTFEPASLETDRLIPFAPVEAKFDKPVELAVSLDGLTDLSTLGADKTPYLVTLDEASGVWVRLPLKSIDREANTVTAELTHFSMWGVGIGPAFPNNHAGVLMFDSAYTSFWCKTTIFRERIGWRSSFAPSR